MVAPLSIQLLKNEFYLTNEEIILIANIVRNIEDARLLAMTIRRSPNAQDYESFAKKIQYNLTEAYGYFSFVEKIAIRLEKKLLSVRGEKKLAEEEKWAIGLCKNIKRALITQQNFAQEIVYLTLKPSTPKTVKLIIKNAGQLENRLKTIETYIMALKQLEIRLERQEAEFAKKA